MVFSFASILIAFFVLVVAVIASGSWRWKTEISRLCDTMMSASGATEVKTTVDFKQLTELPSPVQRYFRTVLNDGQAAVSKVCVEQSGHFDMGLGSGSGGKESWKSFRATQTITTQRPGFIWNAQIRMAPGFAVHVCDAYVVGKGVLVAKILGLFTVAEFQGTPEAAEGELMRFFAEAAWYPTVLLPGEHVQWEGLDEQSAKATFTDRACTFSGVFRFNDHGLIESVQMDRLR